MTTVSKRVLRPGLECTDQSNTEYVVMTQTAFIISSTKSFQEQSNEDFIERGTADAVYDVDFACTVF